MIKLSPFEKAIIGIQREYENNNSKELRMSKAEFNDILYSQVGSVIPMVSNARRLLIDKNLLVWPPKTNSCTVNLEEIKKVAV